MAQQIQSRGRGEDSMLIHMTPNEINSLQGLAMAHGGSLTINPDTGLPEAGFLSSILPMVAGGLLAATGVGAPLAAAMVGGGTGILTGDLNKGLMAGLGAFGGAGLASGLGAGSTLLGGNAGGILGSNSGMFGANMGAGAATTGAATTGAATGAAAGAVPGAAAAPINPLTGAPQIMGGAADAALTAPMSGANVTGQLAAMQGGAMPGAGGFIPPVNPMTGAAQGMATAMPSAPSAASLAPQMTAGANAGMANVSAPQGGFLSKFGDATRIADSGMLKNAGPIMGGLGVLGGVSGALEQDYKSPEKENKYPYEGPYLPKDRGYTERNPMATSSEQMWFQNPNAGYYGSQNPPEGYAGGGEVDHGFSQVSMASPIGGAGGYGGYGGFGGMDVTSGGGGLAAMIQQAMQKQGGGPTGPTPSPQAQAQPQMPPQGQQNPFSFNNVPNPNNLQAPDWHKQAMQGGGQQPVGLQDDSFVVDARTVSELGNGSSGAGQEFLSRYGGMPVRGRGDGVSDDVPASINGNAPARVARDEVIFSPNSVRMMGGGNVEKGANKLYALMDKAQKSRQKAKRGHDSKLTQRAM